MLKRNVGNLDRILRLVAGFALIACVFTGPQAPWGWAGIILIASAVLGTCPAYTLVGMNTCTRPNENEKNDA